MLACQVDSAKECRQNHIKHISCKFKSVNEWIRKATKKLKNARKFYAQKNSQHSKSGCGLPLSCSLIYRDTNWQNLRFQLHHKKRLAAHLQRQIESFKFAPVRVKVPRSQCFVVGCKSETLGNQVCQWDGEYIKFRVPACLESRFGKHVITRFGNYERKINRLPVDGAKTWHFYHKNGHWNGFSLA